MSTGQPEDSPTGVAGPWGSRPDAALDQAHAALAGAIPRRVAVPSVVPVQFVGARRPFAAQMFKAFALYIPSFGFNRFWLKTDQRRFYWLHTTLGGDSFEYRGTARELVVGFLFAVAIYMPFAAAYSLAGLYAETVQAYASLPFFLFTFAFSQYAAFRARRYRLTRTGFRGLRFWMGGTPWALGLGSFGWLVLTAITGGLAYPWMQAWVERYKMRNARFGNMPGGFSGTGWGLARQYLVFAVLLVVAGALGMVALGFYSLSPAVGVGYLEWSLLLALIVLLLLVPAFSVASVIGMRWWLNGITFGDLRVSTSIRATAMIGPALKTLLIILLALGLWCALGFGLAEALLRKSGGGLRTDLFTSVFAVIPVLLWSTVGLIGVSFLKTVFYNLEFVRRIAAATTVSGLETLDTVAAAGAAEGAMGEGLADALGADGF